ncbi:hypothetical protein MMC07_000127 [Pseudocyphellaria aurata]|nr:hypothetical protein [Pseudocyphellaria aurata]
MACSFAALSNANPVAAGPAVPGLPTLPIPVAPTLSGILSTPGSIIGTITSALNGLVPTPPVVPPPIVSAPVVAPSVVPLPSLPSVSAIPRPTTVPTTLLPSLTSILSDLPTAVPSPSLTVPSVGQPLSNAAPSSATSSAPLPPIVPPSLIPKLSGAVAILEYLITLLQQTISTGGVPIPGVAGIGLGVGTNLLPILLNAVSGLISQSGLTIPAL